MVDGNAGNDVLYGDAGNDLLIGGAGADTLYGGDGADTYLFGRGSGVDIINDGGDLASVDVLRFDAGISPADLVVTVEPYFFDVTIAATGDTVKVLSPESNFQQGKVERFEFADGTVWTAADLRQRYFAGAMTAGNDVIRGFDTTDDTIDGGAGNDTLFGYGGNDTLTGGEAMYGGAGNDTYLLTEWTDGTTINEDAQAGPNSDVLFLPAGIGASSIDVRRGYNSSTAGYDDLYLRKSPFSYVVLPMYFYSQSNDYKVEEIRFADGTSWSVADVLARCVDSRITEAADSVLGFRWNDTIDSRGGNDYIHGYQGNDQLSGSAGTDTLWGDAGNDTLSGGTGSDVLYGDSSASASAGDGDDLLDGGAGADTLYGGGGNDRYAFGRTSGSDTVVEAAGTDSIEMAADVLPADVALFRDGQDLVVSVGLGAAQLRVSGHYNAAANQIESIVFADATTWNASDIATRVIAGAANAMVGTAGNDSFVVDNAGDTVTEGVGQGIDSIQSSVSYTLPANVENLALTGYIYTSAFGNDLANAISGNSGDNLLVGGLGADTLVGGAGADTLVANTLASDGFGFDDNQIDSLTGGTGDDIYVIDSDDVVVELAGEGIDTVIWKTDNYGLVLAADVENLVVDNTYYSSLYLTGNALANVIELNSSKHWDTINGGGGADTMIAVSSAPVNFYVDNPGDVIVAGAGAVFSSVDWTLQTGLSNLTLLSGATRGVGNSANNVLTGSTQSDRLEGLGGHDSLVADNDASVDTLVGGSGNDTYQIGVTATGRDVVIEQPGEGTDTVVINGIAQTYSLADFPNVENLSLRAGSTDASNLIGDALANRLVGNGAANLLDGGAGDDDLNDGDAGYTGNDVLLGGGGNDTLLSKGGLDQLDGGAGDDTLNVYGNSLEARIVFGAGSGADTLNVASANTAITVLLGTGVQPSDLQLSRNGADLVLGVGLGADRLTYRDFFIDGASTLARNPYSQVQFDDGTQLSADVLAARLQGGNSNLATNAADVILGGAGGDTLAGLQGTDTLAGGGGDDYLTGDAGNDVLWGGAGADDLSGGTGDDVLRGGPGADVIRFNLGDGSDVVADGNGDTIVFGPGILVSGVTYARSNLDLVISVGAAGDRITVPGFLLGENQVDVRFADGTVIGAAALQDLAGTVTGTAGADTLTGTTSNDRLFGLGGNDTLIGLDGNDQLDGGTGADLMQGGLGDDTYWVDNTADQVSEGTAAGIDTVQAAVSWTLGTNVENLTLTGSSPIYGTGNNLANLIVGNAAANTLSGGSGADTMAGAAGDDIYVVDNAGDVVNENANEGTDRVQSGVSYTLGAHIENLTLTGSGAIGATGNALDNVLTGNSGANVLTGGAGNDTYFVGAGDTTIEASGGGIDTVQAGVTWTLAAQVENLTLTGTSAINGTGNTQANVLTGNSAANALTGGAGDDTYIVGSGDTVVEVANGGTDTVQSGVTWTLAGTVNVENLTLTASSAINGTGNTAANVLTGNGAANTLDGGAGIDTLVGGAGNDTYVVDNNADAIIELAGEGTDLVQSTATSYTLAANVENLSLMGTSAISGTGNALDNVITGNSAVNTLTGGAGNDTYVVTAGDVVVEGAGAGTDTVQAGVTWSIASTADVENLTLTGTSVINGTGNGLDNVLTGNSAVNTLAGAAGNDTYVGGAGNDILNDTSTTSNDVYRWGVGQGNDAITDAGGSDRIEIAAGVIASQVSLVRATNDLQVRISGATDVLTVKNWYLGTANRIEEIRLADGSVINTGTAAPASLVGGMAAALRLGGSFTAAPTARAFTSMDGDRAARLLVQAMSQFDASAGSVDLLWHAQPRHFAPLDLVMPN